MIDEEHHDAHGCNAECNRMSKADVRDTGEGIWMFHSVQVKNGGADRGSHETTDGHECMTVIVIVIVVIVIVCVRRIFLIRSSFLDIAAAAAAAVDVIVHIH
jgi:hypothetical protein